MEHKDNVAVFLSEDEMKAIAMAIDCALKQQGIKAVKFLAPVMEKLDYALNPDDSSKGQTDG